VSGECCINVITVVSSSDAGKNAPGAVVSAPRHVRTRTNGNSAIHMILGVIGLFHITPSNDYYIE
jgi:hypothetical protein